MDTKRLRQLSAVAYRMLGSPPRPSSRRSGVGSHSDESVAQEPPFYRRRPGLGGCIDPVVDPSP